MYDHERAKLTDIIAAKMGIDTPENLAAFPEELAKDKKIIREAIDEFFEDKIAIIWMVEDVKHVAEQEGKEITDEEAMDILHRCLHKHDANLGITWDTFWYYLNS